jgi:hypothetical protein
MDFRAEASSLVLILQTVTWFTWFNFVEICNRALSLVWNTRTFNPCEIKWYIAVYQLEEVKPGRKYPPTFTRDSFNPFVAFWGNRLNNLIGTGFTFRTGGAYCSCTNICGHKSSCFSVRHHVRIKFRVFPLDTTRA